MSLVASVGRSLDRQSMEQPKIPTSRLFATTVVENKDDLDEVFILKFYSRTLRAAAIDNQVVLGLRAGGAHCFAAANFESYLALVLFSNYSHNILAVF